MPKPNSAEPTRRRLAGSGAGTKVLRISPVGSIVVWMFRYVFSFSMPASSARLGPGDSGVQPRRCSTLRGKGTIDVLSTLGMPGQAGGENRAALARLERRGTRAAV